MISCARNFQSSKFHISEFPSFDVQSPRKCLGQFNIGLSGIPNSKIFDPQELRSATHPGTSVIMHPPTHPKTYQNTYPEIRNGNLKCESFNNNLPLKCERVVEFFLCLVNICTVHFGKRSKIYQWSVTVEVLVFSVVVL